MIVNDNGETFIIDRKHSVKNNSELVIDIISEEDLEHWKGLDQIYRQEIAKEMEEYRKKNNLPDTSNQKYKILSSDK